MIVGILLVTLGFAEAETPSGKWSGYWVSDVNGHNGPIKARFSELEDGTLRVCFTGRYAKVIPFLFRTQLTAVEQEDGTHYTVEHSLGRRWGTFSLDAQITDGQFVARYDSADDHGQFILSP